MTMKTVDEIKEILSKLKPELESRYHVKSLGIFGSYVRGDRTQSSDLDVLVEFDSPVGWEIVDLHEFLETSLGVKVDLVPKGAVLRKPLLWQSVQEDLVNV
jgi:hypothetical protein